jgi:hypothetical protein
MSVMTVRRDQQRIDYQRVMARKEGEVWSWLNRNLDGTEQCSVLSESNGLALRVVILSIRAKELLLLLHQEVFSPGFVKPAPSLNENGVWSAWFGYSEPWDLSRYYISLG